MNTTAPARLPASMECAAQRVRMAARTAAERTVDSLGLAAQASSSVLQRDSLLGAQFELNRKLAIFALTFNETLDSRMAREIGLLDGSSTRSGVTTWDALSLVDDHEVEIQVSAERFALEISHACEWEIRELDAYIGPLLKLRDNDPERNPLRAEILGQAMIRAVDAVADRPEVRKVLATEIGRSLALAMRETYVAIVADLQRAGLKPVGLAVRQRAGDAGRRSIAGALNEAPAHPHATPGQGHGLSGSGRLLPKPPTAGGGSSSQHGDLGADSSHARVRAPSGGAGNVGSSAGAGSGNTEPNPARGEMMSLMRCLSQASPAWADHSASHHIGGWGDGAGGEPSALGTLMAPNLIVAHREALRQAATGAIDHMVIDVIAGLFDQILSDPKVAPQMARQIGRLQLPVLRAALGDTSFFSSRRHPVRRFINRIATLGSAVDDFDAPEGLALLAQVGQLVQGIVDGDFEQVDLYEQQLHALEAFIAAQAQAQIQSDGAADQLLARKEDALRVQQRYAVQLDSALEPLPVPEFMRAFLGQVWSKAIASAETDEGRDSALAQRLREIGRELVMSLQPKGVPAQRALFLRQLPQLMKDLNAGLDRIRCRDAVRRDFFAQLMPAHADSLKGQSLSTLEFNLLSRQVDGVLATKLPLIHELPRHAADGLPVLHDAVRSSDFSAAEAAAVGLIDEASVNWDGLVDIDITAEPEITADELAITGLTNSTTTEPAEPMRGKSLADHMQIGFAYQMHLEGQWQKVRLAHVSAARTFFVFSHGARQRKTVSMTYRMLSRMCETARVRAFENAYLIERATARARRQLAALKPATA